MCVHGHHVWPYLPVEEYVFHKDDKCEYPGCEEERFVLVRGFLKHRRVLFYLGLSNAFVDLFNDPEWTSMWKKNMDISNNSVWKSEHVRELNIFAGGKLSLECGGLFSIYDDAFTMCTNGTNGMTLFGIETFDLPYSHASREMNRRVFMIVTPPEPPNTSLILGEAIKEMNELAENGITVRHPRSGNPFKYFPYMEGWLVDAKARPLLIQFGGPGRLLCCSTCGLMSTYLDGTTYYPGAYAYPVVQADYGNRPLTCGCDELQRSHEQLVDILNTVHLAERAVMRGEYGAAARLADIKRFSGAKSGDCWLTDIKYADMRNTVRAAVCHQKLLGLVKADFYPALYKWLGGIVGAAGAERYCRRIQDRTQVCFPACCLPVYPLACLHIYLADCLADCLPAHVPACLSVCLPIHVPACLSVCLPMCLPICLPAYLSAHLSYRSDPTALKAYFLPIRADSSWERTPPSKCLHLNSNYVRVDMRRCMESH